MDALDACNRRWGLGAVVFGTAGFGAHRQGPAKTCRCHNVIE
ncbi:DUF4113 domain-containing protein [Methylobacterium sp. CM6247]|jgi:hypothetical protein